MDISVITKRMAHNLEVINRLVAGVTEEQAVWRPGPETWSILDVLGHLHDEEREDFRTRLDLLLHEPKKEWPGIDPVAWARERGYNDFELNQALERLTQERRSSLAWLTGLENPRWDNSYDHPVLGEIGAGDLLLSWLSHDFLHIRQLAKLHYLHASEMSQPFTPDYAGGW